MAAIRVFIPAILSGLLLVDILWPDRRFWSLMTKVFLGIGIGLGLRSLLYFAYLLILPARNVYIFVDLALLASLLAIVAIREQGRWKSDWSVASLPRLSAAQRVLLIIGGLVFLISLLGTANYLLRRRQGDWDAWMMFNRAARFLYIDQAHWTESFSPQMDPIFHADYPLLLATNIVAGWEMLGKDAAAVPMLQSALFAVACVGLAASALGAAKSAGQAALGVIILWGIPAFVNEGARQMADVPMAFFVLATGALFYFHTKYGRPGLLVLAGLTTGLAAWTKNEGSVLVIGAVAAMILTSARRHGWRPLCYFALGLTVPLMVVLGFRFFLAPRGDILSAAIGGSAAQLSDGARHSMILRHLWSELRDFGRWGVPGLNVGILPILTLYYVLFRSPVAPSLRPAFAAGITLLAIQMLGYYAAYLISPYDLGWHLSYSSTRIVLQVFPLLLFLTLCASLEAESVLVPGWRPVKE